MDLLRVGFKERLAGNFPCERAAFTKLSRSRELRSSMKMKTFFGDKFKLKPNHFIQIPRYA